MTDKELVDKLLGGASLRTFMVPDEAIPSNFPEHIETYALSHVVVKGAFFWGKSEPVHVPYHLGERIDPVCAFCYTNITDVFCSYSPTTQSCVFMSKKRYRKHAWLWKENYRLVWDSKENASTEGIREAIECGAKFKIALLDSEDIWNIHPVELPMYYPGGRSVVLNTPGDQYPIFFRSPEEILGLAEKHADFFQAGPGENHSGLKYSGMKPFYSFYVVRSDGSYHSAYDIPRGTAQRYEHLKVFVERL